MATGASMTPAKYTSTSDFKAALRKFFMASPTGLATCFLTNDFKATFRKLFMTPLAALLRNAW